MLFVVLIVSFLLNSIRRLGENKEIEIMCTKKKIRGTVDQSIHDDAVAPAVAAAAVDDDDDARVNTDETEQNRTEQITRQECVMWYGMILSRYTKVR